MKKNSAIAYIDRIRIITEESRVILRKIFLDDLEACSQSFQLDSGSSIARKYGFESKIVATAPEKKFFEILDEKKSSLGRFKISYIEIAKDIPLCTEFESERRFKSILNHLRKKYTYKHFVYDYRLTDNNRSKKIKHVKEKYSDKTGYWGGSHFKLVIYPRISKISQKPCIHMEWRIRGSVNIKEKTGIITLKDIIDFNIKNWFNEQFKRLIKYEDIDHEKHGRFIQNMKRGQKDAGYNVGRC